MLFPCLFVRPTDAIALSWRSCSRGQKRLARLFSLKEHKKKEMSEKPNDEPRGKHTQAELNKMTTSELLVAIMNRISNDVGDHALARVLSLLDEIALEIEEKT
jgi:hypothetical protein